MRLKFKSISFIYF